MLKLRERLTRKRPVRLSFIPEYSESTREFESCVREGLRKSKEASEGNEALQRAREKFV